MSSSNNWIWIDDSTQTTDPEIVFFRKSIKLSEKPSQALIKVTADSRYRLFINGKAVCNGPRKGDDKIWFYDKIDIRSFLQEGENTFAAIVLHFPPILEKGNRSIWRKETPGFSLSGKINEEDFNTDATWKAYRASHIKIHGNCPDTNRVFMQEIATSLASLQGWKENGYNDSFWHTTKKYRAISNSSLSPAFQKERPIPFLYETEKRFKGIFDIVKGNHTIEEWNQMLLMDKKITIPAHSEEIVEIENDVLTNGYLQLQLINGENSTITILQSEGYAQKEQIHGSYLKGNRLDKETGFLVGSEHIYTVSGYGNDRQTEYYEPFWFNTFRFIRLSIQTKDTPCTIQNFSYRETGYPLHIQTKVETSDTSLQEIWNISENSLRACMQETYVDCPFYEQLQYAMDTRSEILYTYASSADDRLARAAIDDFSRSQRADGLINACYPAYKPNVIPSFSIYFILMLHDHMMYFGDKKFLRKYLPNIQRILEFFEDKLNEEHLVGFIPNSQFGQAYWCFIDWANGWDVGVPTATKFGPSTMDSLLYCYGLQKAAEIAEYLGYKGMEKEYRECAKLIQKAIRTSCMCENGMIMDGPNYLSFSQHVQVFSILTNTLSKEEGRKALEYTLLHEEIPQCTVASAFYLFRAIELVDLYEYSDSLWNKWRNMLKNNLTTCVESDGSYARSDCHAWGALALYELPSAILGIRPAKPGYTALHFSPNPGKLSWAKGQVITPKGIIFASWHKENGILQKDIQMCNGIELEN
ncbi:MAG: alpha-L-rhamnosidase N-terminal domain-containing protein [Firmicutes bacterium]|nr:alpha-L-rhamnosidase N-terminal domain-containing protein [Bacillota bacterium]